MTYKIMPKQSLDINGYYDIKRGKTIVSYCKICRQQRVHRCVGSKKDGQEILYRFQCTACKERLNKR
ncbi:MAG: hypothetical protein ACOC5T_05235 [Elusimicrobiota bacterium]